MEPVFIVGGLSIVALIATALLRRRGNIPNRRPRHKDGSTAAAIGAAGAILPADSDESADGGTNLGSPSLDAGDGGAGASDTGGSAGGADGVGGVGTDGGSGAAYFASGPS